RVSLMAGWEKQGMNCIKISRGSRPPFGSQFIAHVRKAGPKDSFDTKHSPTTAKTGSLRIVRSGSAVYFFASDGDKDFELLCHTPLATDDLENVRIAAATDNPTADFDVRMKELTIRADGLLMGQTPAVTSVAATPVPQAIPAPPGVVGQPL